MQNVIIIFAVTSNTAQYDEHLPWSFLVKIVYSFQVSTIFAKKLNRPLVSFL